MWKKTSQCLVSVRLNQCAVQSTEGRHAVTQRSSSPQDNKAAAAGPHARCCHGCKGGEGEAVSSGNTHAAARWWLLLPSGDDAALTSQPEYPPLIPAYCVHHHHHDVNFPSC